MHQYKVHWYNYIQLFLLSSSLTMLLKNSVKGSYKSFTQYLQFVNLFSNCFLDIELSGYVTLCLEIRFYICQYSKSYIYECNIIMRLSQQQQQQQQQQQFISTTVDD